MDHNPTPPPPPPPLDPPSSSSSVFLDLTLATSPYPFLSPKLEPLDDLDLPDQHLPLNPNPNHLSPKPEPHPDPIDDDPLPLSSASAEDLFSALLALQLHLKRRRPQPPYHSDNPLLALAVLPPPPPPPPAPLPKPPPRSSELVRVSASDPRDRQHLRDSLRRTRATYESLRTILNECSVRSPSSPARRGRADLDAAAIMARHGLWLNRDKRVVGSIPGLLVGDIFFFRMELCVVGLHGQVQAGIDYVSPGRTSTREPIATSVVVSGGYEDDEDTGDVIVYTGHGGRSPNGVPRQALDQKLECGNLALERSMHYNLEIRVVRGFRYDGSPSGRVYVYDGLYRIAHFWRDRGKSGFSVLKYKLVRLPGQDDMGTSVLRRAEVLKDQLKKNPSSLPPGYLSPDISNGKENLPVSLFNDIDDDRYPLLFEYLPRPVHLQRPLQTPQGGCACTAPCGDGCSCAERNGGGFAYDSNGILLMGKPLVFECGAACRCPPTCRNRVTQKGVRYRLEVFRSLETGWGVRSLDLIRAGSFICEYSGVAFTRQQAEVMSMNGDCLVHPGRFPNRWYEWGDVSSVLPDNPRPMFPPLPHLDFAIDVSATRNVACYLSQSCSPNVFLQFVLFDHHDASCPHLMIFAMENIPPLRELSIDYGVEDAMMVKSSP